MRKCVRIIFFTKIFLVAFKMSNGETSSKGEPQDMDFMINAIQQPFEHLNMVLGEIGERMNRYDTVVMKL